MATWAAVQGTLLEGGKDLLQSLGQVSSPGGVISWLNQAFFDYPDPAVKIMSGVIAASLLVFTLAAFTNNYRYIPHLWLIFSGFLLKKSQLIFSI